MRVITGYLIRNESRNGILISIFKVTAEFGLRTAVKERKKEREGKKRSAKTLEELNMKMQVQ